MQFCGLHCQFKQIPANRSRHFITIYEVSLKKNIILLLLSAAVYSCGGDSQTGLARKEFDTENYANTIKILENVIASDSTNVNALELLCRSYLKLDKTDRAVETLQSLRRQKPDNKFAISQLSQIWLKKGNNARESGDLRKALGFYDQAENIAPNTFDVPYEKGQAYLSNSFLDYAHEQMEKASKIAPDDPRPRKKLVLISSKKTEAEKLTEEGSTLYKKGRWRNAEKKLNKAISVNGQNKDSKYYLHMARGRRLYKKGSVAAIWDAITDFGLASSIRAEEAEPIYYMAQCYEKKNKKDFTLTVETYRRVVDLAPGTKLAKKSSKRINYLLAKKKKLEQFWGKKKK